MKTNENYQYLLNMEKRARYKIIRHYYKYVHVDFNILIVNNLMCNGPCHIVALFKNYLLEDDDSEYLRRIYRKRESIPRLKKLFVYYEETSVIFPNYTPLVESKYLYNNVIKKQRVIDEQQDLEDKKNNQLKGNRGKRKNTDRNQKNEDKVFTNTAYDEILNVSESILRIVFGLDNQKKTNNEKSNNKNDDNSDNEEIDQLINNLDKAEEVEQNTKIIKTSMKFNKSLKLKLNIEGSNNMGKLINYDLVNNITNSTSISSSNNINNNINTKQNNYYENKSHTSFNFNTIFSQEKGMMIKKIVTSPKISKENNSKIFAHHKKNKSTLPNITLYNTNFNSANTESNNLTKSVMPKTNINNRNNSNRNIFNTQSNYFKTSNNELRKNSNIKSKKIITQVPKLDINKIKNINSVNIFNKTITNRIIHHGHSNTQTNDLIKSGNRTSRQNTIKNDLYKGISRNPITVIIASPLSQNSKQKSIYKKEVLTSKGNKSRETFGKIFVSYTNKQASSNNKINKKRKIYTSEVIAKSKDYRKKNLINKV